MKLADAVAVATKTARAIKEDEVRRAKGRVDLDSTIVCYRGTEPVAIITLPPDRDDLLRVAHIAARGFSPDIMAVTHDSYIVSGDAEHVLDPRTGKIWARNPGGGPGSMQTYVEEFGFDGTVLECLVTYVLNRAGDSQIAPEPYEVDGRSVVWKPMEKTPTGSEYSGDVPAALKAAMAAATMDQMLPDWGNDLLAGDPERGRFELDMGTLFVIEQKIDSSVVVRLFAKPGSRRAQFFRTRLARSQVIDPSKWN
jgi:hypothetical protein